MRRVSPTNSRPWEDKEVFYSYGAMNLMDELAPLMPAYDRGESYVPIGNQKFIISRHNQSGDQTHHISGGILGTPRWDVDTNLIRVSQWTHAFAEKYTRDGFALCAVAKIKAGTWDRKRMAEIMHVDSTIGYLLPENGFEFPWVAELVKEFERRI